MKREAYFSRERCTEELEQLKSEIRPFERHPERRSRTITPGAALLVMDVQRYFLQPESHAFLPSALVILPRIVRMIDVFRSASLPVLFTRHGNRLDETGPMMRWWGGVLETGGPLGLWWKRSRNCAGPGSWLKRTVTTRFTKPICRIDWRKPV